MDMVLGTAMWAALLALAVGIFRPGAVVRWRENPSRWYAALVYGGAVVGIGVLVHLFVDLSEYETAPDPVAAVEEEPEEEEERETDDGTLDAAVRVTSTQVHVTNEGGQAWSDCTVGLNPGFISDGHTQSVARIAPGETVTGGLMAFTDGGGARFNPATHVVEEVMVTCRVDGQTRLYLGALR